jgi:phosphatidylserine/phosphatidylglycerophosphate/cardiolipin synthase-like enzyme
VLIMRTDNLLSTPFIQRLETLQYVLRTWEEILKHIQTHVDHYQNFKDSLKPLDLSPNPVKAPQDYVDALDSAVAQSGSPAQILRTWNKTGEESILRQYLRAIRSAQGLLYFENQYFRDPCLAEAIIERQNQLGTDKKLCVIVVTNRLSDEQGHASAQAKAITEGPTFDTVNKLREAGIRLHLCYMATLEPPPHYASARHAMTAEEQFDIAVSALDRLTPEQRTKLNQGAAALAQRLKRFDTLIDQVLSQPGGATRMVNAYTYLLRVQRALGKIMPAIDLGFLQILVDPVEYLGEQALKQIQQHLPDLIRWLICQSNGDIDQALSTLDQFLNALENYIQGWQVIDGVGDWLSSAWNWATDLFGDKARPSEEEIKRAEQQQLHELNQAVIALEQEFEKSQAEEDADKPSRLAMSDDIYVHSKVLIVDNAFYIIGSANINQRSMRHDTEIAVSVRARENDPELVKRFREGLWGVTVKNGAVVPEAYEGMWWDDVCSKWGKLLKNNTELKVSAQRLNSHVVPFEPTKRESGSASLS